MLIVNYISSEENGGIYRMFVSILLSLFSMLYQMETRFLSTFSTGA